MRLLHSFCKVIICNLDSSFLGSLNLCIDHFKSHGHLALTFVHEQRETISQIIPQLAAIQLNKAEQTFLALSVLENYLLNLTLIFGRGHNHSEDIG